MSVGLAALAAMLCGLVFVSLAPQAVASPPGDERSQTGREAQGRIVNGTPAPAGAWPSIARLYLRIGEGGGLCGGTLIDRYTILTAAHCLIDTDRAAVVPAEDTFVSIGSTRIEGDGEYPVYENYVNGGYNPSNYDGDIAAIVLDQPATEPPMPLARKGDEALLTPGTTGHIAGWGTTCSQTCPESPDLLEATVPVREWAGCSATFQSEGYDFTSNMFCAGGGVGTSDTCQGDSGGPFTVDSAAGRTLVGVVSWGVGCADPNFPGAYTDLMKYGPWIGTITIDRVQALKSLRVRGRSTIRVKNLGNLRLPASIFTSTKGRFKVIRNTCRNIPYGSSCSVTVKDRSRRITRGTLTLLSGSDLKLKKISLRG